MQKKKIVKNIIIIGAFMILGAAIGYYVVQTQQSQLTDPEYIKFWSDKNMHFPEPIPYKNAVIGFLLLFGGIPTGIIGYSYLVKKYVRLNCIAKPLFAFISVMLFPLYTVIGAVICIPVIIIQFFMLIFMKENLS